MGGNVECHLYVRYTSRGVKETAFEQSVVTFQRHVLA